MNKLSDVMLRDASRARQIELLAEASARRERAAYKAAKAQDMPLQSAARTFALAIVKAIVALLA